MDPWLVDVLVYMAGLALILLEMFIPSGGVLGISAVICIGYSLYSLFDRGQSEAAYSAMGVTGVYLVVVTRFWLKRMRHADTLAESVATGADVKRAAGLVGATGVTLTSLRPAGIARIDGARYDVVTSGGFIDSDEEISVVEVSGNRIVVRRHRA